MTRAGAAYESGKLNALANQIRGITGAEATRISSVGSIYGGLLRSLGVIDTEKLFSNESAAALAKLNIKDIAVRNQQAVADMNADRKQQSEYIKTDQAADTKHWWGSKILRGADWFGGAARTLLADSKTGRQTVEGRIAGTVIELGGAAWGLSWQHQSIQERAAGKQTALDEAFNTRISNQELASLNLAQNQGDYVWDMVGANERRAMGLTFAEISGAYQSAAGANLGADVAKGGINQGYQLDLQANKINYEGAVSAAAQVRDASFEAAILRAVASVVSAVGHNIARDMEQGLTLRY